MAKRGVKFEFAGLPIEEPKPPRELPEAPKCAVPSCPEWGSFGFRPPGWEHIREPTKLWLCHDHSKEYEAGRL